jgi:hypothetical protein
LTQITKKNSRGALAPFAIAVIVAVLGTVALFLMEFSSRNEVASSGISMVTAASVDRAGATVIPTVDNITADKNRSSYFRIVR